MKQAPPVPEHAHAQTLPLGIELTPGADGAPRRVMLELACRIGNAAMIAGWKMGSARCEPGASRQALNWRTVRVERPDVAAHFSLPDGDDMGFVLLTEGPVGDDLLLNCSAPGLPDQPVLIRLTQSSEAQAQLALHTKTTPPHVVLDILMGLRPFTTLWNRLVCLLSPRLGACPQARGHLEWVAVNPTTGEGVLAGWALHQPSAVLWIESDDGQIFRLDRAFRTFRQDVLDAMPSFGSPGQKAGLVAHVSGLHPGQRVQLKLLNTEGLWTLGEATSTGLSDDPLQTARQLFGIETPLADLQARFAAVDHAVLGPLLRRRRAAWAEVPVDVQALGPVPSSPLASVIVPLYGRMDFVEHQLLAFSSDPVFRDRVELIYVIDDPRLNSHFRSYVTALHQLYDVPLRWVWGGLNRGYAGANNLGAGIATAPYLVFLNSDAFPCAPGWLESLTTVLRDHPKIGVVGPRLLFADGSIQHAGMEFRYSEAFNIWTNHHPMMGLDPSLDRRRGLTLVPAVTGACLTIRRSDFEAVGGWNTDFLVGDFEDSDLCLQMRDKGLQIAYLPEVSLTHLERQSFRLLDLDAFRQRVTLYNAFRHQQRWRKLIESDASGHPERPTA
ncbi:MAG: glycosyltransferase family 2 protein [Burkholderiales bacterium]|nr:glycosyltransferase family 2 protein [Burkholderiales bacterium]